jgi:hypothetical protein
MYLERVSVNDRISVIPDRRLRCKNTELGTSSAFYLEIRIKICVVRLTSLLDNRIKSNPISAPPIHRPSMPKQGENIVSNHSEKIRKRRFLARSIKTAEVIMFVIANRLYKLGVFADFA